MSDDPFAYGRRGGCDYMGLFTVGPSPVTIPSTDDMRRIPLGVAESDTVLVVVKEAGGGQTVTFPRPS